MVIHLHKINYANHSPRESLYSNYLHKFNSNRAIIN